MADGTKNLKLTFYTAASGGIQLYTFCATTDSPTGTPESLPVTFTNGTASVLIGDTSITCNSSGFEQAIPATLFDNTAIYLGVTVNADSEMTPRKRVVAVGFALNADKLDDLDVSAVGGSGAFVPVTDSSGNFTLTKNVTVDTNTFFVDAANNRVGVGTAGPGYNLDISGSTVNLQNTLVGDVYYRVRNLSATAGATTYFVGLNDAGNTVNMQIGSTGTDSTTYAAFANRAALMSEGASGIGLSLASRAASSDIRFYTSGIASSNERMRIDASGNVGIGDVSPDALLDVAGTFQTDGNLTFGDASGDTVTSNAAAWTFANDTAVTLSGGVNGINFDSDTFSVDATNNRVGIGTSSPNHRLEISGSDSDLVYVSSGSLGLELRSTAASPDMYIDFTKASTSTAGAGTPDFSARVLYAASSDSSKLKFSNGGSERLTIDTSGNVGIGTTSPQTTLHLQSAGGGTLRLNDTSNTVNVNTIKAPSSTYLEYSSVGSHNFVVDNDTTLSSGDYFNVFASSSAGSPKFSIQASTGNVGVNVIPALVKFHVEDNTNSNSALEVQTVSRTRADATAPGAADFGGDLTWRLEGFTNNSSVLADRVRGAWEAAQANDTTDRDSYLSFATMLNNAIGERMRITSAGNVGIGTPTPGSLLTVGSQGNFGVNSFGDLFSAFTTLDGSSTASGAGANSTTLVLAAGGGTNFDVGNYVQVAATACVANPCYAKITAKSTDTLTISPALSWSNTDVVTEVHVPEIGGIDLTQALANRYGRGYFIDGIVTGNGSTRFTDNLIDTTANTLNFNTANNRPVTFGTGTVTVGGGLTVSGALTTASGQNTTFDTNTLFVDATNDRLGVGTTSPITQLHVPGKVPSAATGSVATGTGPQGVFVQGRYAYVANYSDDTFRIFDVSNPASPVQISSAATDDEVNAVSVQGRYAYVTSYGGNTLRVWDVSNPAAPTSVGSVAVGFKAYGIYVQGRYAYVTNAEGNSLRIFDVSNPAAPVFVSSLATGGTAFGVSVQGRYAYVTVYSTNTLKVIDIANPAMPIEVGTVATGTNPAFLYVQGRYAYVGNFGGATLQVFDVSNPASPASVGTVATGTNPASPFVQGRYAYVANYGSATLQVFDVSNPASPASVGTVATGTSPRSLFVQGRYAYVANYGSNTLQVFDVGGSYIQQVEAGGIETGTLNARNAVSAVDGIFTGGLTASGGLRVSNAAGIDFRQLYSTAVTTPAVSHAALSVDRQLTTNTSFASTLTVSGTLASITDNATQTTGTITSTSDVLQINQKYASNSGTALNVTTAGTGVGLRINDDGTFTDATPFVVDATGSVGIGDATPAALLTVGSGDLFQVSSVGAISTTIANMNNAIGLTVTQNDTTNNPRGVSIVNAGTANTLFIDPNGVASSSTSTGGAVLLENTGNSGAGMVIYSNNAAGTNGRLLVVRADNTAYDTQPFYVENDGTSHAAAIVQNSTGSTALGLSVVSVNPNDTTVGITGQETGKGTLKVTHKYTGTADTNAAALSILLDGTSAGTAAQGIFMDSTASQATTGKLLNLRNDGIEYLTLSAAGLLTLNGDVNFTASQVTRNIKNNTETAGNAGDALIITAGAAGTTSGVGLAGGGLTLSAGAGTAATSGAGGAGGNIALTATAGTNSATSGNAGAGGAFTFTSGAGGASAVASTLGGNGGNFTFAAGSGGAASSTSATGGNGGGFVFTGAVGGNSSSASSNPGSGSAFSVVLGAGGVQAGGASNPGGAGGAFTVTGGAGGNATSGSGNAGVGSAVTLTTGTGGANTNTSSTGAAGNGGGFQITTGNGGANTGPTSATGAAGAGGTIQFTTGNGGAGSLTSGAGGAGGGLTIILGNGGAGTATTASGGVASDLLISGGTGGAGGSGTSTGGVGSSFTFAAGAGGNRGSGGTSGNGGAFQLTAGTGGTAASGGNMTVRAGTGGASAGTGGNTTISGGNGGAGGTNGNLLLTTGSGGAADGFMDFQIAGSTKLEIDSGGNLKFLGGNSQVLDFNSASNGNTFNWKIPTRSSGTCSSGVAEGVIFKDTGGTQRGHMCIDSGTPLLKFYADQFNTSATDVAETYSTRPEDGIGAGDVVELDSSGDLMIRKTSSPRAMGLLGVISTVPGIVLTGVDEATGERDTVNGKLVALKGRVPVKVTMENGPIAVGDFLTSSSTSGSAMKASTNGMVIGRALDAAETDGTIRVFLEVGWWNGGEVLGSTSTSEVEQIQTLGVISADIDMSGYSLRNVSGLHGLNDVWNIGEDGAMVNRGTYATDLPTDAGAVRVYAQSSKSPEIVISGSGQLANGEARIDFDQDTRNVISGETPLKVTVTLTSDGEGVFVTGKDVRGFNVKELRGGTSAATFDWVVVARRKGFEDPTPAFVELPAEPAAEPAPAPEPAPEPAPAPEPDPVVTP